MSWDYHSDLQIATPRQGKSRDFQCRVRYADKRLEDSIIWILKGFDVSRRSRQRRNSVAPAQADAGIKTTQRLSYFPGDAMPTGGGGRRRGSRTTLLPVGGGSGDDRRMRTFSQLMDCLSIPNCAKAISVIAYNFAAADLRILNEEDEPVDVKSALPALWALLNKPNPDMDGFTLKEYVGADLQLTGNAVLALDSWSGAGGGTPTEIFRLRPDMLRIVRLKSGILKYIYDVQTGSGEIQPIVYDQEEIIHFRFFHPKDAVWGLGPCEMAEIILASDRSLNDLKYNFLSRGAVLDGVLTTDGELDDIEYERLLTKWRAMREGSGRNKFRTAILWQGAKFEPIQEPMGSVPISELSMMSRNDILQVFGVPPSKIGDFSDVNYNNARSADEMFWSDTMIPLLRRCEPGWNQLLKHFDDSGQYHSVYREFVITDYKTRAETAFALSQTGAFTRNDIRVAAGYEPFEPGNPLGEVIVGSTRQQLFPGEYEEPLDFLPMTPERLLGVEEDRIKQPAAPAQISPPTPATAATLAAANNGNTNGTAPGQVNKTPGATTRAGIGRSSTGRKAQVYEIEGNGQPPYPEGLLSPDGIRLQKRKRQIPQKKETPDD